MHLKHKKTYTKATNAKDGLSNAKTKATKHWFSCLLRHPARKQCKPILTIPKPT